MKKYLFNMERNDHNIFLAINVAKNNEDMKKAQELTELYEYLHAHQINHRYAYVYYDIWEKATEVAQGAIHYRARCNAGY